MSKSQILVPRQGSPRSIPLRNHLPKEISKGKWPFALSNNFPSTSKNNRIRIHTPTISTHARTQHVRTHRHTHIINPSRYLSREHSHAITIYSQTGLNLKPSLRSSSQTDPRNSKINALPNRSKHQVTSQDSFKIFLAECLSSHHMLSQSDILKH